MLRSKLLIVVGLSLLSAAMFGGIGYSAGGFESACTMATASFLCSAIIVSLFVAREDAGSDDDWIYDFGDDDA